MIPWKTLVLAAEAARGNAHAPYSGFAVGAALLLEDGSVVAGCNVENRTFGLTLCAERTAMARAVADGNRQPLALVVITDTSPPAAPCGLCREALYEFAEDLPILLVNPRGEERRVTLAELLPEPFVFPKQPTADS